MRSRERGHYDPELRSGRSVELSEALMRVSGAMARRDTARLRSLLASETLRGAEMEVDEVILQAALFLGYPAALDTFATWTELRSAPAVRREEPVPAGWEERGTRLCQRVYGRAYDSLRRNVASLHPDLDYAMVTDGYGRVLSRPGLSLCERELNIVVLLAASDRERQLPSHLRGALRAGAGTDEVSRAMEIGCSDLPVEARSRLYGIWTAVRSRAREGA